MTDVDPPGQAPGSLDDARELVLRAFAWARASGRENWRVMTVALLKNRLLDLTEKKFDESRWGAGSTRKLASCLSQ